MRGAWLLFGFGDAVYLLVFVCRRLVQRSPLLLRPPITVRAPLQSPVFGISGLWAEKGFEFRVWPLSCGTQPSRLPVQNTLLPPEPHRPLTTELPPNETPSRSDPTPSSSQPTYAPTRLPPPTPAPTHPSTQAPPLHTRPSATLLAHLRWWCQYQTPAPCQTLHSKPETSVRRRHTPDP